MILLFKFKRLILLKRILKTPSKSRSDKIDFVNDKPKYVMKLYTVKTFQSYSKLKDSVD
ncbi:hypothetical protein LEP1GSC131_1465 [Leptospira kirschneri str. 200802841]|uniref:Uncharacterized protein n=1 Tax=Leptospira kirschneri str. 200802841 TaxID=1193047 RepID=A0A828Y4M3_9LEPT|nr:hypothetical protein LEP1GSC131_1465 [Leptospira kirschneri str. 200802841]